MSLGFLQQRKRNPEYNRIGEERHNVENSERPSTSKSEENVTELDKLFEKTTDLAFQC